MTSSRSCVLGYRVHIGIFQGQDKHRLTQFHLLLRLAFDNQVKTGVLNAT
uniref:Uncharacterized protein n=1 Tax=Anguilla anguilla TaxID=7936 RepID=A0A0E9RYH7_ANGAN